MASLLTALVLGQAVGVLAARLPVQLETRAALSSRLSNIHLTFDSQVEGLISYTYGSCSATSRHDSHHIVGHGLQAGSDRLVWVIPTDVSSGGCLSAWTASGILVGRSQEQTFRMKTRKRGVSMTADTGIDVLGAWFDGVELLQAKTNLSTVDVQAAKCKKIGIVGAGMSGLMT